MNEEPSNPVAAALDDSTLIGAIGPLMAELRRREDRMQLHPETANPDLLHAAWVLKGRAVGEFLDTLILAVYQNRCDPMGLRPAEALLRVADRTIDALYWLASNRPDDLKPHARKRSNWPAFVDLRDDMEAPFRALHGEFDKAGNRIGAGPIELGMGLPYTLNRKTKTDLLLDAALEVLAEVFQPSPRMEFLFEPFIQGIGEMPGDVRLAAMQKYRASLGPFQKGNWANWRPVLEHILTLFHGPSEQRWERIPERCRDAFNARRFGCEEEWIAGMKKTERFDEASARSELDNLGAISLFWGVIHSKRLFDEQHDPDVQRIIRSAKGNRASQWSHIKDEVLKKIKNLALREYHSGVSSHNSTDANVIRGKIHGTGHENKSPAS